MYEFSLNGKVAMVTGAASGLGTEYAETLAEQGCSVALVDYNLDKARQEAERIAEKTGKHVRAYSCDVGSEPEVKAMVAEAAEDFGRIDILVNNAGILLYGPKEEGKDAFMDYSVESWERVMRTNLTGPWLVTREVVKQSMQFLGRGRVVNVASVGGIRSTAAGCPSYHASKAGVIMLTASQAAELAPYGILVNAISPGSVRNGTMYSRSASASREETWKTNGCPLQRSGKYGEVSALLVMLVSDENTYINGQNIVVDGGGQSRCRRGGRHPVRHYFTLT